jgi:hypothetical protein
LAVPPETLNDKQTHPNTKQTVWTTLPQQVQHELVQAVSAMLAATLLAPSKEQTDD